jgi:hypothetical protein
MAILLRDGWKHTLTNPMSEAFSLKHWRQILRPYLRIRPALCVQTRLKELYVSYCRPITASCSLRVAGVKVEGEERTRRGHPFRRFGASSSRQIRETYLRYWGFEGLAVEDYRVCSRRLVVLFNSCKRFAMEFDFVRFLFSPKWPIRACLQGLEVWDGNAELLLFRSERLFLIRATDPPHHFLPRLKTFNDRGAIRYSFQFCRLTYWPAIVSSPLSCIVKSI